MALFKFDICPLLTNRRLHQNIRHCIIGSKITAINDKNRLISKQNIFHVVFDHLDIFLDAEINYQKMVLIKKKQTGLYGFQ